MTYAAAGQRIKSEFRVAQGQFFRGQEYLPGRGRARL
jgi:hypothetical protein